MKLRLTRMRRSTCPSSRPTLMTWVSRSTHQAYRQKVMDNDLTNYGMCIKKKLITESKHIYLRNQQQINYLIKK